MANGQNTESNVFESIFGEEFTRGPEDIIPSEPPEGGADTDLDLDGGGGRDGDADVAVRDRGQLEDLDQPGDGRDDGGGGDGGGRDRDEPNLDPRRRDVTVTDTKTGETREVDPGEAFQGTATDDTLTRSEFAERQQERLRQEQVTGREQAERRQRQLRERRERIQQVRSNLTSGPSVGSITIDGEVFTGDEALEELERREQIVTEQVGRLETRSETPTEQPGLLTTRIGSFTFPGETTTQQERREAVQDVAGDDVIVGTPVPTERTAIRRTITERGPLELGGDLPSQGADVLEQVGENILTAGPADVGQAITSPVGTLNVLTGESREQFTDLSREVSEFGTELMLTGQEFAEEQRPQIQEAAEFTVEQQTSMPFTPTPVSTAIASGELAERVVAGRDIDITESALTGVGTGAATLATQGPGFLTAGTGGLGVLASDAVDEPVETGREFAAGVPTFLTLTGREFAEDPVREVSREAGEEAVETLAGAAIAGPLGATLGAVPTPEPTPTLSTASIQRGQPMTRITRNGEEVARIEAEPAEPAQPERIVAEISEPEETPFRPQFEQLNELVGSMQDVEPVPDAPLLFREAEQVFVPEQAARLQGQITQAARPEPEAERVEDVATADVETPEGLLRRERIRATQDLQPEETPPWAENVADALGMETAGDDADLSPADIVGEEVPPEELETLTGFTPEEQGLTQTRRGREDVLLLEPGEGRLLEEDERTRLLAEDTATGPALLSTAIPVPVPEGVRNVISGEPEGEPVNLIESESEPTQIGRGSEGLTRVERPDVFEDVTADLGLDIGVAPGARIEPGLSAQQEPSPMQEQTPDTGQEPEPFPEITEPGRMEINQLLRPQAEPEPGPEPEPRLEPEPEILRTPTPDLGIDEDGIFEEDLSQVVAEPEQETEFAPSLGGLLLGVEEQRSIEELEQEIQTGLGIRGVTR